MHWEREIGRVLPPSQYPIRDLPLSHPLFRTQMHVLEVPQITAIQSGTASAGARRRSAATTAGSRTCARLADEHGRLLVVMSHNTDVADAWEREAEDRWYFERFSPDGYGLGINVLLYTMMH